MSTTTITHKKSEDSTRGSRLFNIALIGSGLLLTYFLIGEGTPRGLSEWAGLFALVLAVLLVGIGRIVSSTRSLIHPFVDLGIGILWGAGIASIDADNIWLKTALPLALAFTVGRMLELAQSRKSTAKR